ncbi:hypothetical protein [Sinorhizobium meliloti]
MIKWRKGILVTFVCVLFTVAPQSSFAAGAPKGECPNLWKMYGLFMSASLQCNFAESNAIRKALHRLKQVCPQSTEQQARRYVKSGFAEFEKQLKRDGRPKACGEMFTFMDAIGG